ncbi:hypothetical protein AKJ16_DCAP04893 [Drosera capensis]
MNGSPKILNALHNTQGKRTEVLLRPISSGEEHRSAGAGAAIPFSPYQSLIPSKKVMAGTGSSMLLSFLLFTVVLSVQEIYRGKLASSELFTILGGFSSAVLFLLSLTFIGNFQESSGMKTGWGAVILSEAIALIAASTFPVLCRAAL